MNLKDINNFTVAILVIGLLTTLVLLFLGATLPIAILGFGIIAVLGIVAQGLAFYYEVKNRK